MQGQLNVWDNIANYKKCRKKSYEIHVCMPPKNTIVINKLEQYDTYVALGKKDHFTADEVAKMKTSNPQMLATLQNLVSQGKAYAVTQNTPFVLAGTIGEMWCISPDKLAQTYMFLQGGQPVAINQQSLQSRMKNGLMDWTLIRTSQQAQQGMNMACFVPTAKKGQIKTSWGSLLNINGAGVPHGKGDFVICDMMPNGQPNLANRWVVNGEVFANTYDNHGWTDCLSINNTMSINISQLPKLFDSAKSSLSLEDYKSILKYFDFSLYDVDSLVKPTKSESYYSNSKNAFKKEFTDLYASFENSLINKYNNSPNKLNIRDIINVAFDNFNEYSSWELLAKFGELLLNIGFVLHNLGIGAYVRDSGSVSKALSKVLIDYVELNILSSDTLYNGFNPVILWSSFSKDFISIQYNSVYNVNVVLDFSRKGLDFRLIDISNNSSMSKPNLPSHFKGIDWSESSDSFYNTIIRLAKSLSNQENSSRLASKIESKFVSPALGLQHEMDLTFGCFDGETNLEDHLKLQNRTATRFRFKIYKDGNSNNNLPSNTCTLFINLDSLDVHVSAKLDGLSFDKNYKIGVGRSAYVVAGLIFVDFCRLFKLNPAKTLYGSNRSISNIVKIINDNLVLTQEYYIKVIDVDKTNGSKISVRFNILRVSDNVIVGTRTFVLDFNYKQFDFTRFTQTSSRLINELRTNNSYDLGDLVVATYIARDNVNGKLSGDIDLCNGLSIIGNRLAYNLDNLLRITKKY